jgi:hypothetical protein
VRRVRLVALFEEAKRRDDVTFELRNCTASHLFLLPLPLRSQSLASHTVVARACSVSFDAGKPHCYEARSPTFLMRFIDMLGTSVSDASPDCPMSRTTSVYCRPTILMFGSISDTQRNLRGSASRHSPNMMMSTTPPHRTTTRLPSLGRL